MKFTANGKKEFLNDLLKVLKNEQGHDLSIWVYEAEEHYSERGAISFKVERIYTKSGRLELISIDDSMFEGDI